MDMINEFALKLISSLLEKEQSNEISIKWNCLADCLNSYNCYEDIPFVKNVSNALYLYTKNYTNKDEEEEYIRSFTTFCLLKRAVKDTIGKERIESLIQLTLLMSKKMKYLMPVYHYTLPRNLSNYDPGHFPSLTPEKADAIQKNYDSIKYYIYSEINKDINKFQFEENLKKSFIANSNSFLNRVKNESYNLQDLTDGKEILDICYKRLVEFGKYPLRVIKEDICEFYKSTRGLVQKDFEFKANKCMLIDGGMHYAEAPTDSTFVIRMKNGKMEVLTFGIKDEYICSFFSQEIYNITIEKLNRLVQIQLKSKTNQGNGNNVPVFIEICFNKVKMYNIQFTFMIGKEGKPRYINFWGDGHYI